ncbi:MAG: hypothetical protein A2Y62_00505 [Candidatus Fischerbacteria bacterium RBG_13_37_8]|uniref:DUF4381 domain-containing protein n=1 Tax=Candidatus Fischerbacteria bacterium RBG_13_37_8 TaxID=1817863 RepID=A0A1F5VJ87_9BACT|nr:MAG: hypothetical protein A2Y62_00505 [Candidatus Fischerbacteria bacterium RBG_13_37_8]
MKKMKYSKVRLFILISVVAIFIMPSMVLFGQGYKPKIVLSMQVSHTKVALNRTVDLKAVLSWIGEMDRFSIVEVENPLLSNFEIAGTSSSSRSEVKGGETHIFKEYVYTLKPKELGMGYVDVVNVRVRDNTLGNNEDLTTQRIPVEVIDPIPEKGKLKLPWYYIIPAILILIIAVGGLLLYRRKKERERQQKVEPPPPTELEYLENLRNQFNLDQPNLHDDFFGLSRLLRRYLSAKFSIRALELTTDDVAAALESTALDTNQLANVKRMLLRCDEIKFSGTEGTREELMQFYTLFEGMLEVFLRKTKEET